MDIVAAAEVVDESTDEVSAGRKGRRSSRKSHRRDDSEGPCRPKFVALSARMTAP